MSKKLFVGVLGSLLLEHGLAASSLDTFLKGNLIPGEAVFDHLQALEDIAVRYNVNRAAGTEGHELSGNYIAQKLLAAGYNVELQPFEFKKYEKISGMFAQVTPSEIDYQEEKDFNVMTYSGSGDFTGPVVGVDLALGAGNQSTSGCEKEDFTTFPEGSIALIQRGTCAFGDKVVHAQAAGAKAVIIFNQGNSADREELFQGTLSEDSLIKIPVVAIAYPLAVKILETGDLTLRVAAQTKLEKKVSFNVIAESKSGDPDNVVMLGAHLDSVAEGPGINDNGSGSAAILEVALRLKNINANNKLRFGWFSAEELGLIGSTKYVESLSEAEKNQISLYVNVDMVGSPNYTISVFDGDGSKFGQKGPEGSAQIEQLFHNFFNAYGSGSVETELNGRSDYAAFSAAGIAVGGIFTGAEGIKSEAEADLFGGEAGAPYDACYHKHCDNTKNISIEALEINTNAIGFLAMSYAHSTQTVRSANKMSSTVPRKEVVFPKHGDCHGDIHHE